MLKTRSHLPTYNDGIVSICRERDRKTTFGAKINAETMDDLIEVVRLAYSAQSIREQDFEFSERLGFDVSLKLKTRLVPGVDSECKALVGGLIYDISHIDRTKTEMYIYLEGGAPFGVDAR